MQVLWIDPQEKDIVPFDKSQHVAHSFICYEDTEDNMFFILSGGKLPSLAHFHNHLANYYIYRRESQENELPDPKKMVGAGSIKRNVAVTFWFSNDVDIVTPKELRPKILEALQMHDMSADYHYLHDIR